MVKNVSGTQSVIFYTNPWVVVTTFERIEKPLSFPNPKMRGA